MGKHSEESWKRLGDGSLPSEEAGVGLGHIVSIRTYNAVFFSLLMLTFITVWAASQDVGETAHLFIALTIATIKAGIVTLFFMHLLYESKIIWGIVIYPIFIFLLIVLGTLGDAAVKNNALPVLKPIDSDTSKSFGVHQEMLRLGEKPHTASKNHHGSNSH